MPVAFINPNEVGPLGLPVLLSDQPDPEAYIVLVEGGITQVPVRAHVIDGMLLEPETVARLRALDRDGLGKYYPMYRWNDNVYLGPIRHAERRFEQRGA